jgi:hypothetical protein
MRYGTSAVLLLMILASSPCSAGQCCWFGVERVVAVGDVHGDLDQFRKVLRSAGLIDDLDRWSGGKTHLVQTGDVLDRGPDSRKVMDLLWSLGKQAGQAGGYVHALIGNHEAMVFEGDFRYVHEGECLSHGGEENMTLSMSPGGLYGNRILAQNAVIRIDDVLFLHGGLSTGYTGGTIQSLNRAVRTAMTSGKSSAPILGSEGPLWYRGYAELSESELWKHVQDLFVSFGTRHAVAGHTVSDKGILLRCHGRVVQIDTGLSRYYGGAGEFLLIEHGKIRIFGP